MGTLSWAFVLSALSVLAVLYVFSRRDEFQVRRDWRHLLSPRSEEIYGSIKGRLDDAEPHEIAITVALALIVLLLVALQVLR